MSCPSGYSEYSDSETRAVVLEGYTTINALAFRWRHEIDWEYSYCAEDGGGAITNSSIDYHNVDVRNEYTDWGVNYEGLTGSGDDDMSSDGERYTSYRQAHYSSAVPFIGGAVNKYPTSEIRVNAHGGSKILQDDV